MNEKTSVLLDLTREKILLLEDEIRIKEQFVEGLQTSLYDAMKRMSVWKQKYELIRLSMTELDTFQCVLPSFSGKESLKEPDNVRESKENAMNWTRTEPIHSFHSNPINYNNSTKELTPSLLDTTELLESSQINLTHQPLFETLPQRNVNSCDVLIPEDGECTDTSQNIDRSNETTSNNNRSNETPNKKRSFPIENKTDKIAFSTTNSRFNQHKSSSKYSRELSPHHFKRSKRNVKDQICLYWNFNKVLAPLTSHHFINTFFTSYYSFTTFRLFTFS